MVYFSNASMDIDEAIRLHLMPELFSKQPKAFEVTSFLLMV